MINIYEVMAMWDDDIYDGLRLMIFLVIAVWIDDICHGNGSKG